MLSQFQSEVRFVAVDSKRKGTQFVLMKRTAVLGQYLYSEDGTVGACNPVSLLFGYWLCYSESLALNLHRDNKPRTETERVR